MYSRLRSTAGDRDRTGTVDKDRRILSPVRLPVPPLRHRLKIPGLNRLISSDKKYSITRVTGCQDDF